MSLAYLRAMNPTSFVSYNINGIRAGLKKGLAEWMSKESIDVIGFQEIKALEEQVDMTPFSDLGYHAYWHSAEKKGYSGVMILSKQKADLVKVGMGSKKFDREGRVIRADFGDLTVVNAYFPSGTTGDIRQEVKYKFLKAFYTWALKLKKERPNLIIMGDYNIAHEEIDIHNPKGNKNNSGFLPDERAWMTKWFKGGFSDSFRELNPDKIEYSWWTYRANARANNKGWRIDYISVSDELKGRLDKCDHREDARQSDHCPVFLRLKK